MDKPETRKEAVDADRADPSDGGGWFFLKGKESVAILRAFARWDLISRVLGLVLLGVCAFYLRLIALALVDLIPYARDIKVLLGK